LGLHNDEHQTRGGVEDEMLLMQFMYAQGEYPQILRHDRFLSDRLKIDRQILLIIHTHYQAGIYLRVIDVNSVSEEQVFNLSTNHCVDRGF
jgi:hypothetical protein